MPMLTIAFIKWDISGYELYCRINRADRATTYSSVEIYFVSRHTRNVSVLITVTNRDQQLPYENSLNLWSCAPYNTTYESKETPVLEGSLQSYGLYGACCLPGGRP